MSLTGCTQYRLCAVVANMGVCELEVPERDAELQRIAYGMSILPRNMNYITKNLVGASRPMANSTFNKAPREATKGDMEAAKLVDGKLQKTIDVFNYLNYAVLGGCLKERPTRGTRPEPRK
ncbi:predicted protein [Histoplasma capsulatum var. duboisii H88]|uniref:Predicted protein n=1 Tax=Ajellomyces capsulatus (strain H88) TaxID=544711 RepID=F0UVI6_AJEC8|nr:predicted protein [Histoplasma capsulatum var. duboisii H88]